MANFIKNNHENSKIKQRNMFGLLLIVFGGSTASIIIWYYRMIKTHQIFSYGRNFIIIVVCIYGCLAFLTKLTWRRFRALNSGLRGESSASKALRELSDEYIVLQNISLERNIRRTEIDLLVVSQYGIHIVEVKNHNGDIVGRENDSVWQQHKVGRKGTPYTVEIKNPLKQVEFQKYALSKLLNDYGIDVKIDCCVWMPSVNSVYTDSDDVIVSKTELIQQIKYENKMQISRDTLKDIINILA